LKEETNYTCGSEQDEKCFCPLEGIINTISKKWTLQIIAQIGNHKKLRYNEIKERLGGISPKSLADRLKELEKESLIKREAFAEIPPRVEYTLTNDGETLRKSMMPLMEWASTRTCERSEDS
jgi:DNA-binding HxlR family transcriptional regulator